MGEERERYCRIDERFEVEYKPKCGIWGAVDLLFRSDFAVHEWLAWWVPVVGLLPAAATTTLGPADHRHHNSTIIET